MPTTSSMAAAARAMTKVTHASKREGEMMLGFAPEVGDDLIYLSMGTCSGTRRPSAGDATLGSVRC